jgi:hypothetical protein
VYYNRDQWRAVVNTVMNVWVQEELNLMKLAMLLVVIVVDIHTVKTSKNCIHKLYKE